MFRNFTLIIAYPTRIQWHLYTSLTRAWIKMDGSPLNAYIRLFLSWDSRRKKRYSPVSIRTFYSVKSFYTLSLMRSSCTKPVWHHLHGIPSILLRTAGPLSCGGYPVLTNPTKDVLKSPAASSSCLPFSPGMSPNSSTFVLETLVTAHSRISTTVGTVWIWLNIYLTVSICV